MEHSNAVHHFWTPPEPGETIVGMKQYKDMLVIATSNGVYVISEHGRPLPDWDVQKILAR